MADAPNSPHPSEPSPPRLSSDPPRDSAEPPERTTEKTRRAVDFELDDGDAAWEDEDEQLAGLGTTTHRSRNRRAPVIPVRKHRRVEPGVNVRATARKHRGDTASKMQNLAADLDELEAEREERAQALSAKHGMKVKEVRRRMLSASAFKTRRKASLYNAKISRIMRNLNEDRGLGERYKIPEVKRMVAADASMLEGFTPEEEEEMMADLVAKCKRKYHGKRANNLAASTDAKRTVERLMLEITGLAERAGMIGFAMFTRGHIHDTSVPVTIQSWGALDFFREVLKKDPADISALFELWAVNRERGETGSDTLIAMQQECTAIIKAGLQAILGKTKVAMNYENYIKAIVEGKNVGLVGWPEGVDFKRMSKQSAIGPLRILRDALKCGTCKWKVLTAGEKSRLLAQFKEMVKNGEVHEKVRKVKEKAVPRASGRGFRSRLKRAARERGSDDDDEEEEDESRPRKARLRPKRAAREWGSDDDDEQEEDESRPRNAIADMSVQEKRERLLSLAKRARKTNVDGKRGPAKTKKRKRDERADDDDDERPTHKKHAGAGEDESSHPRRIRKRSDRGDGDEDEAGGGRKKKRKSDDAPRTKAPLKTSAPPAPLRLKPKPKPHVAAPTAGNPNGPLTSTSSASTSSAPVAGAPTASSAAAHTSTPNTDPAATAASSADAESAAASRRQNVVVGKRGGPPGHRYIA
ncbi:hypothetical protein DFH08DRAFT_812930 [Mycena albidolilacea]|uniref:Uncharacterized protein n=1 Tax=Mycena albidolilacea TaxID=1033008 RepID=A0AAD7ELQ1_9AGAR|nr:hypothetical protein DFH08DRAFT_812930 [Mycena albidolilacea]